MANQIPGITENLIKEATKEFLKKGYKDASLREICKNANTTTSSVYVRFKDKLALFSAIVEPVKERATNTYIKSLYEFNQDCNNFEFNKMNEYTRQGMKQLVNVIYENFDEFKILICCSEGTKYSNFIGELADIEAQQTLKYIDDIKSDAITSSRLTPELLHMLSSAYWSGLFEVVYHDMNKSDAIDYFEKVRHFFSCGWKYIIKGD